MERMCIDHILVHWLVLNCWFGHLEFKPFLSTWGAVTIGTLSGGAIVLCVEQKLDVLSKHQFST